MRAFRTRTILACALLAASACAADDAAQTRPAGTPISIDETHTLSVGLMEGDTLQEFHRVVTPFLLPDGRLVVPLSGASTIRVFGPNGAYVASHGRAGKGPGEFSYLYAAWPRGDTIEALDGRLRRITRFLPDGSTEVVPIRTELPDLSAVAGVLGEGWAVGGVAVGGVGRRDSIVVRRIGGDGSDLGAIAHVEGFARFRGPVFTGPEPLSPMALLDVGTHGVYVAESLTPAIRVFAQDGALEREMRWSAESPGDARDVLRAVSDSAVARAQPDRAAATRRQMEAAPVPDRLSLFWKIIADDEGFIWIRPYDPMRHAFAPSPAVGPGGRWTILSPAGAPVGTVDVPTDLEPIQITRDAVVGIVRDELGVESVRVHTLRRR